MHPFHSSACPKPVVRLSKCGAAGRCLKKKTIVRYNVRNCRCYLSTSNVVFACCKFVFHFPLKTFTFRFNSASLNCPGCRRPKRVKRCLAKKGIFLKIVTVYFLRRGICRYETRKSKRKIRKFFSFFKLRFLDWKTSGCVQQAACIPFASKCEEHAAGALGNRCGFALWIVDKVAAASGEQQSSIELAVSFTSFLFHDMFSYSLWGTFVMLICTNFCCLENWLLNTVMYIACQSASKNALDTSFLINEFDDSNS